MSVFCAWAQFATLFYTPWKMNLRVTSSCEETCRSSFRNQILGLQEGARMLRGGAEDPGGHPPSFPSPGVMSSLGRQIQNIRMLFPSMGLKP